MQKSQNQRAFAFLFGIFAFALAFLLSFAYSKRIPVPQFGRYGVMLLLLNAFVYSIADRSIWRAAKLIEASTLSVIIAFSGLIYLVFSVFLYHESILTRHILGIFLTVIAITLASGKLKVPKHRKGILIAVIAGLAIGTASSLDKIVSQRIGVGFYNYAVWGISLPFLLLLPPLPFKTLAKEWQLIKPIEVLVMAFLNVTGFFLFLYALRLGESFKVLTFMSFITVITVLGGLYF